MNDLIRACGCACHIGIGYNAACRHCRPQMYLSAPPALDVERLAKVLQNSTAESFGPLTDDFWHKQAEALAAEYARLASQPGEET